MDSICNRLKNLRESKNYKQLYVANYLGISQQNYSRYENEKEKFLFAFYPCFQHSMVFQQTIYLVYLLIKMTTLLYPKLFIQIKHSMKLSMRFPV